MCFSEGAREVLGRLEDLLVIDWAETWADVAPHPIRER
jgi:hypothetical protein